MSNVPITDRVSRLQTLRSVIERRVNQFGLSEVVVRSAISGSDYKVIVEIPGEGTDVETTIASLKQTAELSFWAEKTTLPEGLDLTQLSANDQFFMTHEDLGITGNDLKSEGITSNYPSGTSNATPGSKIIQLTFTNEGAQKFNAAAVANRGKPIYIILDRSQLLSSPVVATDFGITGFQNTVEISGSFTAEEADTLAAQLRAGALPVSVTIAEQKKIDPSLGKDALEKSLYAGAIGIGLIIVFMVISYGKEGIVASIALVLYTLFTFSLFKIIPITLSLAGIAGFILSIGIAVDANILIFERMREELKKGVSRRKAFEIGFERAWTSIRDSNTSTLITCLILFLFGSTVAKGFAINLALGVIVSLFTAVVVTRQLLILLESRSQKVNKSN